MKVKDGITFRGKSWSYVMRVTDPKSGKSKPTWVSGFDTRESAELARDEARLAKRKRLYVPPTSILVVVEAVEVPNTTLSIDEYCVEAFPAVRTSLTPVLFTEVISVFV